MRTYTRYNYGDYKNGGFVIFRCWGSPGEIIAFAQDDPFDADTKMAFYKGDFVAEEALNPAHLGIRYEGFYDFTKNPELNTFGEWQLLRVGERTVEWFCFHTRKETKPSYAQVMDTYEVPLNHSVVVIEGVLTVDDNGNKLVAREMNHIKPRSYSYTLTGSGKAFVFEFV